MTVSSVQSFCPLKGIVHPKTVLVPVDFHSRERNTMEVNGEHQLFDYQNSSKYLLLCSRKKLIEVWNDMRVSKWWLNFQFWVNYPLSYIHQQARIQICLHLHFIIFDNLFHSDVHHNMEENICCYFCLIMNFKICLRNLEYYAVIFWPQILNAILLVL